MLTKWDDWMAPLPSDSDTDWCTSSILYLDLALNLHTCSTHIHVHTCIHMTYPNKSDYVHPNVILVCQMTNQNLVLILSTAGCDIM